MPTWNDVNDLLDAGETAHAVKGERVMDNKPDKTATQITVKYNDGTTEVIQFHNVLTKENALRLEDAQHAHETGNDVLAIEILKGLVRDKSGIENTKRFAEMVHRWLYVVLIKRGDLL